MKSIIFFLYLLCCSSLANDYSCKELLNTVDPVFSLRPNIDLKNALTASGLEPHSATILKDSKGIFTIHQIASNEVGVPENAVILSLNHSNVIDVIQHLQNRLKAKTFADIYTELQITCKCNPKHTEEFLSALINTNSSIILLVPPGLMTFKPDGVTKKETEWLLSQTSRLTNVYFVFGAYEFGSIWQDQLLEFISENSHLNFWKVYRSIIEDRPYKEE